MRPSRPTPAIVSLQPGWLARDRIDSGFVDDPVEQEPAGWVIQVTTRSGKTKLLMFKGYVGENTAKLAASKMSSRHRTCVAVPVYTTPPAPANDAYVRALEEIAWVARDQFLDYAIQHRAKGTSEADAKAEVNLALARRLSAVLHASKSLADPEPPPPTLLRDLPGGCPDCGAAQLRPIAQRIRRQIVATQGYLIDNGIDEHFASILLSHYADFAGEIEELSQ
jgi:hypothetical protein